MKYVTILLVCILLAGCAAKRPDLTREQWLDMTSHTFKNTTVNDVLSSGEKVLRLSDPSDVSVYHVPNKMIGSRKYTVYAVLTAAFGNYNFDLTATQNGTDVETHLLIGHSAQSVMPMMTYTPGTQSSGIGGTASTGIANVGAPMDWREQYDLFFSRIESIIYTKPWITCSEATDNKPTVALESLCLFADDNIPEGIQLSERSSQIVAKRELKKQRME
jgi:hypothetical protein